MARGTKIIVDMEFGRENHAGWETIPDKLPKKEFMPIMDLESPKGSPFSLVKRRVGESMLLVQFVS